MTRRLLTALALAGPLLLAGCTGASGTDTNAVADYQFDRPASGADGLFAEADRNPAPPISGEGLDGEPIDLADYEGEVVVLNFWAQWCGPCRAEAPFLEQVYEQTEADGVQFVGINVKDDLGEAQRFDELAGTSYPSIFDQPGVTLSRFRKVVPQTPPTTLLIDRQGRIAGILNGGQTVEDLLGPVQKLAAEQA